MDKQEYAPSIPHIAHHKEYAEEIVDDFVARQKKEWKQLHQQKKANCILFENCNNRWTKHESIRYLFMNGRFFRAKMVMVMQFPVVVPPYLIMNVDYIFIFRERIESTRKRLYKLYGGIFPTFELFCEALDEINNVPFACLVINNTSHSDDQVMIYIAPEWPDWRVMVRMKKASLDVIREELIRRTWHPSRVMQYLDFEDEREIFVADIMRTASAKLGAHLQLRAAYKREPISPFKILSIWAFNDGPVGVAVPLASADDYLLSDAVNTND
eukprot:gene20630-biopygen29393